MHRNNALYVWSFFIRFFHWALAAAFAIDYITQGKPFWLHKYAGIFIFTLLLLRFIAGFFGSPYARFRDFIYAPGVVLNYLKSLLGGKPPKRYIGHSPAGGAMVIALLACLFLTSGTGLTMFTLHRFFPSKPVVVTHQLHHQTQPLKLQKKTSTLKKVHYFLAQTTLVLIVFHILGVMLASYVHRENLTKSMITGWKKRSL